ncbi:MAG TPA: helix-turn-helix domain-containing protein [Thermoanaerobaculia bacterium]|jgi:AcrR family transcriptional regulator|nr:helix-turn-helix domain-containing protein [Thermoanaerobaculia bacterium]
MTKKAHTRLGVPTRTADDWEEAALDAIAARGAASVSIPELARTLDVTKGSFYWHFAGLDDLVRRAVARWDRLDKETLDQIRAIDDPAARLQTLFAEAMAAKRAQSLYLALAVSPVPSIATALRKVSSRRLKLLADTYQELGMTELAARQQALLAYSAYIGGVHLRSNDAPWLRDARDVNAYVEHASLALIETARKTKAKR